MNEKKIVRVRDVMKAKFDTVDGIDTVAHALDTNHSVHKGMVHMAERLADYSDGAMRIDIYPSGQLGVERETVELLQIGSLAMTKVSTAPLEAFVPQMKVFSIPYLFRDRDHYFRVLDSEIGKALLESSERYHEAQDGLAAHGVKVSKVELDLAKCRFVGLVAVIVVTRQLCPQLVLVREEGGHTVQEGRKLAQPKAVEGDPGAGEQQARSLLRHLIGEPVDPPLDDIPPVLVELGRPVLLDGLRRAEHISARQGMVDRLGDQSFGLEPLGRADMQRGEFLVAHVVSQLPLQEVPEQVVIPEPLALVIDGGDEEVVALDHVDEGATAAGPGCR